MEIIFVDIFLIFTIAVLDIFHYNLTTVTGSRQSLYHWDHGRWTRLGLRLSNTIKYDCIFILPTNMTEVGVVWLSLFWRILGNLLEIVHLIKWQQIFLGSM